MLTVAELRAAATGSNARPGWQGALYESCAPAPLWRCEHEHRKSQDALDCAVEERTRRMTETPEQPPMEVWLRTQDDRRIACDLRRDPEMDRNRVTYWEAIPQEQVELGTYDVEVITPDGTRGLPPHTGFHVRVEKIGPGLDAIGKPPEIPAEPEIPPVVPDGHNHMTADIRDDCPKCRRDWPQYMPDSPPGRGHS